MFHNETMYILRIKHTWRKVTKKDGICLNGSLEDDLESFLLGTAWLCSIVSPILTFLIYI